MPDFDLGSSPGPRSRPIRVGLSVAVGLALAACSGGGGGGTGAVGTGAHPQLTRVEFGRLVDVYGLRVTPQGAAFDLYQKDVLIGPDIQDERGPGDDKPDDEILYDFLSADPDTLQPRLFIPRDMAGAQFAAAFAALDDHVTLVTPMAFGQGGPGRPYSVVPRNAAIRLQFSASLGIDDGFFVERGPTGEVIGIRNAEAVQLLQMAGDPSQPGNFRPLTTRIVVRNDNLILDPVLLGTEGLQYQTRNNAAGLPESPDPVGANIRIALALEGPLALPGLRPDDLGTLTGLNNSGRQAIIRDFRSGNAEDTSAEVSRGFVRDPIPPRIVGEIVMYLERLDPVNAFTQEATIFKNGVVQEIDRGDVFRFVVDNSGVPLTAAEVVADPEDDRGRPEVQHVRVRIRRDPRVDLEAHDPSNLPGYPSTPSELEPWLVLNAPKAVLVTEFQAGGREDPVTHRVVGDDPRYFVTFSPTPLPFPDGSPSPPNENVSPFAGAVVRFTKPVDLSTVKWADTLFFGTRNLLDPAAVQEFVATRPWQLLSGTGQVTASGVGMDPAAFDENKFRTPHLIGARVVDEDGSQTSLRLQPSQGFYLDQAMRQDGNRPYFVHLLAGNDGVRDLSGNPVDLQADTVERGGQLVIPFTLDVRSNGARPQFEDNLAISIVRRNASTDEDEQPSYLIPSEVQGSTGGPNARAFALADLFGAFVQVNGQLQARPTTRVRTIADNLNQAPVASQGSILRWCPEQVAGEDQVAANTSTTPFGQGIQNPLNPYGCRLQTVWREIDLSLSRVDPFDFDLDVEQMYWAPFASGTITFDEFDRLSLFLGHSERRPEPCVGNFSALATFPDSGLNNRFDDNYVRNPRANATDIESRPDPFPAYVDAPMRIDSALAVYEPNQVNRFLPLPQFQRPYFVFRDETVVEQGCVSQVGSDIQNGLTVYNPWILSPWNNGNGRRAIQDGSQITFVNAFWNNCVNYLPRVDHTLDRFTEGLVGNVALPLLADFWTYCDSPDLPEGNGYVALGTNGWQISLTVQSGAQPNFRVLSSGRAALSNGSPPICLGTGSNDWNTAAGGYTPAGGRTARGDNSFYWIMLDFLKRQSVVTNGFVDLYNPHRVPNGFADSRLGPYFLDPQGNLQLPPDVLPTFAYEFDPPLTQLPGGTSIVPQFRAASVVDPLPWYWDEWVQQGNIYPAGFRPQLKPDAVNFPLDPFKAADAHIRKYDDRQPSPSAPARNWWSYFYNRTVTGYVLDPNVLMDPTYLSRFAGPNEGFTPRDVRYVNWRYLMSNNTDANPPVAPSIETFSLSYRFQRTR